MNLNLDTEIVIAVLALAALLNPDARAWLRRARTALRFYRNGYRWRSAWHLAEGR